MILIKYDNFKSQLALPLRVSIRYLYGKTITTWRDHAFAKLAITIVHTGRLLKIDSQGLWMDDQVNS